MLSAQLDDIRSAALKLPDNERVKLVNDLIVSLHGKMDAEIAAAWDIEICRRITEIQSGQTELLDASDVIMNIKERIGA